RVVPKAPIGTTLVTKWISYCEQNHRECQTHDQLEVESAEEPPAMLLIDVRQRKLTSRSPFTRYLALSYVWDAKKEPLLTRSKVDALKQDGALDNYQDQISPVLADAITFVRVIGEQCLWVDTLCIVQDGSDRHETISRMDEIYNRAVCEQILAKPCIYFAREQVYFQCSCSLWFEDRYDHYSQDAGLTMASILTREIRDAGHDVLAQSKLYTRLVEQYTSRSLSYESDGHNAFQGIERQLSKHWGWTFRKGLPAPQFVESLLWRHSDTTSLRIVVHDKSDYLPSWSWSGWTNDVQFA
ncbi:hypothetical protein BDV96DRAFT_475107, partial [Lophiotrema nucula]